MTLFLTFILSMMVTLVLIPPLMKSAGRLRFVDSPDERKIHIGDIPRIGGVAMSIGVILPVFVLLAGQSDAIYLYIGIMVLLLFGILDDRFQLDFKLKFVGQIAAVLVVVLSGGVLISKMPLWVDGVMPMYVAIPFTVFALLGVTNATNLSDGLDGLAGGMSLMSFAGTALIAYSMDNLIVLTLSVAVMGSILGFLRFNTFPAKVFMGDTGSQFLGFTLGIAVILVTQQEGAIINTAIPLFLLGLPILDTITVMVNRISKGRSPFSPDRNHIHHRLLAIGFHHHEAVMMIYAVQAAMVVTGYLLRFDSNLLVLSYYFVTCIVILGLLHLARIREWHVHRRDSKEESRPVKYRFEWMANRDRMLCLMSHGTAIILGLFFVVAAGTARDLPVDTVALVIVMLVLFFVLFLFRTRSAVTWLERIVIYTLGTMVIYIMSSHSGLPEHILKYQDFVYILLVAAVMIGFRYSNIQEFGATPLDFLMIFVAVIAAILPELQIVDQEFGLSVTRLIILFYAMEFVLVHISGRLDIIRYCVFAMLAIIGLNGLLNFGFVI